MSPEFSHTNNFSGTIQNQLPMAEGRTESGLDAEPDLLSQIRPPFFARSSRDKAFNVRLPASYSLTLAFAVDHCE